MESEITTVELTKEQLERLYVLMPELLKTKEEHEYEIALDAYNSEIAKIKNAKYCFITQNGTIIPDSTVKEHKWSACIDVLAKSPNNTSFERLNDVASAIGKKIMIEWGHHTDVNQISYLRGYSAFILNIHEEEIYGFGFEKVVEINSVKRFDINRDVYRRHHKVPIEYLDPLFSDLAYYNGAFKQFLVMRWERNKVIKSNMMLISTWVIEMLEVLRIVR